MVDVHNQETRSRKMVVIYGKYTKPELLIRKALDRRGFRYALNDKALTGKPNLVLPKYKTVIFVNDYFWHTHE